MASSTQLLIESNKINFVAPCLIHVPNKKQVHKLCSFVSIIVVPIELGFCFPTNFQPGEVSKY
jgi:hypothetical protein